MFSVVNNMELQRFDLGEGYSFSLNTDNFSQDSDIHVIFRHKEKTIILPTEICMNLFGAYNRVNKLLEKFTFQGRLTYFIDPEESDGITNLSLVRKYNRTKAIFQCKWYVEGYRFGDKKFEPNVIPVSRALLRKLRRLRGLLSIAVAHWESKVLLIATELIHGPQFIFTAQYKPVYFSLQKAVSECEKLHVVRLGFYTRRFLAMWCKKGRLTMAIYRKYL
jgi:hypothetical protein